MDKKVLIANILGTPDKADFSLQNFTYEERFAYLSIVSSLAWADGSIDGREENILNAIAKDSGPDIEKNLQKIINDTQKYNVENFNKWVSMMTQQDMKVSLMIDMFQTAFADKVYMKSEMIYMKYIAEKLGIGIVLYNDILKNIQIFMDSKEEEEDFNDDYPLPSAENTQGEKSFLQRIVKSIIN
ncbi:MAG: TerB family tellurite resistance protein [Bacteroidales bacterium]|nr:TerB family tellurite resistance protein [Bacteroidales bacterium]